MKDLEKFKRKTQEKSVFSIFEEVEMGKKVDCPNQLPLQRAPVAAFLAARQRRPGAALFVVVPAARLFAREKEGPY